MAHFWFSVVSGTEAIKQSFHYILCVPPYNCVIWKLQRMTQTEKNISGIFVFYYSQHTMYYRPSYLCFCHTKA